jgi:hypothetical protein
MTVPNSRQLGPKPRLPLRGEPFIFQFSQICFKVVTHKVFKNLTERAFFVLARLSRERAEA